jgi:hypothetical protein
MKINLTQNNHWTQAEKIQILVLRVNKIILSIALYQEKTAINLV